MQPDAHAYGRLFLFAVSFKQRGMDLGRGARRLRGIADDTNDFVPGLPDDDRTVLGTYVLDDDQAVANELLGFGVANRLV